VTGLVVVVFVVIVEDLGFVVTWLLSISDLVLLFSVFTVVILGNLEVVVALVIGRIISLVVDFDVILEDFVVELVLRVLFFVEVVNLVLLVVFFNVEFVIFLFSFILVFDVVFSVHALAGVIEAIFLAVDFVVTIVADFDDCEVVFISLPSDVYFFVTSLFKVVVIFLFSILIVAFVMFFGLVLLTLFLVVSLLFAVETEILEVVLIVDLFL
jgi:hypothetical protein